MATPTGSLKSAPFRATTDGRWIFRSPNPWVFGDTPHYLVNDAQKAQIEARSEAADSGCRALRVGRHCLGGLGCDLPLGLLGTS